MLRIKCIFYLVIFLKIVQSIEINKEKINETTILPLSINGSLIALLTTTSTTIQPQIKTTSKPFQPSPQLDDIYIEYNKFPVPPAIPEHRKTIQYFDGNNNLVKFPSSPSSSSSSSVLSPAKIDHESIYDKNQLKPIRYDWDQYREHSNPTLKTYLEETPSYNYHSNHHLSNYFNFDTYQWKKVIKFLTALIPIGLLISALTPTVITVTPANETMSSRYRILGLDKMKKLHKCEDKILCELLLSAIASKNGEKYVENLLTTYSKNASIKNRKDEIKKVFQAVERNDCSTILCDVTTTTTIK